MISKLKVMYCGSSAHNGNMATAGLEVRKGRHFGSSRSTPSHKGFFSENTAVASMYTSTVASSLSQLVGNLYLDGIAISSTELRWINNL